MKIPTQLQMTNFYGVWECANEDCKYHGHRTEWSYMTLARSGGPVCGECGDDLELLTPISEEQATAMAAPSGEKVQQVMQSLASEDVTFVADTRSHINNADDDDDGA